MNGEPAVPAPGPTSDPAAAPSAAPPVEEHAQVLAEIEKLKGSQGSWLNAVLVLAVSLAVFLGIGMARWEWSMLLALIPVLFFHEMGHWVAMRAFRYRNLRMFFIPLVGAAVTGRSYNVPGWKKAVVSLAGPVPGIVAGAILGAAGIALQAPFLVKAALLALVLNGLNLLPLLPLDGGWLVHTTLFSRHHLADVAFRLLAALALIAGGAFGSDKLLLFLGAFTLLGVPLAHRLGIIARDLKAAGVAPHSQDEQTIPREAARAIIARLKAAFPRGVSDRVYAQHTLAVFETLNARPPGALATLLILTVQAASFAAAALFVVLLVAASRHAGGLG